MKIISIDEFKAKNGLQIMEAAKALGVSHPTFQKAVLEGAQVEIGKDGKPRLFKEEKRYYGRKY